MDINEAKIQIENAMRAYFTKDEYGNYIIPPERQRPVFLVGAPGIGKTAIMEQIADDMGVCLLSYSMTHHTRQSAIGLPYIEKKVYGGVEYSVSEYTMSEIIASVYEMMESTGKKEGILFLDEINCVSETLAPTMLQFLQYKVFGRHRVPKGWIVVTAGNPPEYNNSVREFDIVTLDRMKKISVEPSYEAWKKYAVSKNTHPAILTYLELKKNNFYKVESSPEGKKFVTARGWSDLSDMLKLYEQNNIQADENLICQYLQDEKISEDFSVYYDLFKKYRSDYQIEKILSGKSDNDIKDRAEKAKFDERLALTGLLIDKITLEIGNIISHEKVLENLVSFMTNAKSLPGDKDVALEKYVQNKETEMDVRIKAQSIGDDEVYVIRETVKVLQSVKAKDLKGLTEEFTAYAARLKKDSEEVKNRLSNIFKFVETVFGEGEEMLIIVTELTESKKAASFINRYGCEEYFKHNKGLLFYERGKEINSEIEELGI